MRSIELLPVDLAVAVALGRDSASLADSWEAPLLQRAKAVADRLRQRILTLPGSDLPWGGYLALDPDHWTVVGTCGFKGAPTPEQAIEIAYHTFPDFEGRGYATAMARTLVEIAWSNPELSSVCAHTLPRPSASTRVLKKAGMSRVAEVNDRDEGRVWRWRITRPAAVPRAATGS